MQRKKSEQPEIIKLSFKNLKMILLTFNLSIFHGSNKSIFPEFLPGRRSINISSPSFTAIAALYRLPVRGQHGLEYLFSYVNVFLFT